MFDFDIIDDGKINRVYLVPNEAKIRKLVQNLGKDAEKLVGGIRVRKKTVIAAGGR